MPHVYFIGNQKEFATSLVQGKQLFIYLIIIIIIIILKKNVSFWAYELIWILGLDQQYTRIVLLPSFSETGIVTLVNLSNLKCHTTYFPSTFF